MKKKAFNFKRLSFKQYQPLKLLCIMFLIVKCMHPDDGDTQAPTAPANLRASNITTNSVDLQWDASTDNVGVIEYDIYKRDTLAGTTKNTSYTVGSLSAATDYSFFVFAKDAAGNISPHSNIVKVSTLSSTAGGRDTTGKIYQKSGSLIYTVLNEEEVSVKAADTSISGHVSIPDSVIFSKTIYAGGLFKVTEIAKDGFEGCTHLTTIDIPNTVKKIGHKAFRCCYGLTHIDIPTSVRIIERETFQLCRALKDVYVHWTDPSNIVNIEGKILFHGISPSAVLHIPEGLRDEYISEGWGQYFAEVVEYQ